MAPFFDVSETTSKIAFILFILLFVSRYLRTFVGIWTFLTYPNTPILSNPTYRAHMDVSVVVPTTFKNPVELANCIRNILGCRPAKVFIVTSLANLAALEAFSETNGFDKYVKCLGVKKLNKRKQILAALQDVRTAIVAFADDDVFWPNASFLDYMLALFEDPKVGAGGPRQRVRRSCNPNGWWFLGCAYLERRVFNNLCTQGVDGSISTLSGRTSLYRTSILRSDEFFHYFQTDSWLGHKLNSDDDKCLTRWVYSNGWQIKIQGDQRATIETTLEEDSKFLSQCLRWARAHWRGNFTVMTNNTYWYSTHYWGLYVIYIAQFQAAAIGMDALLMALLVVGLGNPASDSMTAISVFAGWILFSKNLKMIPHYCRHPGDLKFVPLSIFFSYAHGFINLFALATLHRTHWGSQNLGPVEEIEDEYVKLRPYSAIDDADSSQYTLIEEVETGGCWIGEALNDYIVVIDEDVKLKLPVVSVVELGEDDD